MKYFIKLNLLSFLYGFVLSIQTELAGNVYRLERITHLFNITVIGILGFVIFIVSTIVFYFITARYFNTGLFRYFSTILWFPYYIILAFLFSYLIPITNPGDEPSPALGLLLIFTCFVYPFYIAIINVICTCPASPNTKKEGV